MIAHFNFLSRSEVSDDESHKIKVGPVLDHILSSMKSTSSCFTEKKKQTKNLQSYLVPGRRLVMFQSAVL